MNGCGLLVPINFHTLSEDEKASLNRTNMIHTVQHAMAVVPGYAAPEPAQDLVPGAAGPAARYNARLPAKLVRAETRTLASHFSESEKPSSGAPPLLPLLVLSRLLSWGQNIFLWFRGWSEKSS